MRQRTLNQAIDTVGIGLHSGRNVRLVLRPAPANTGIVFRRIDLPNSPTLPANAEYVGDTRLSSTLARGEVRVGTIEHLMCAFAGLGVDNAYVDLDAPEVPIMDGSAAPFVFLLQAAGLHEQHAAKTFIRIKKPIHVEANDKWASFTPYDGFRLQFQIAFSHPAIARSRQQLSFDFSKDLFGRDIARARTFGFMHDLEHMRAQGLGMGGSMDNAIVLDSFRVLNSDGLRFEDEFVRHKILDAIGDLYLIGKPILGAFSAYKSGHALNNQLVRAVLHDSSAWEFVEFPDYAPSWDNPPQASLTYPWQSV